MARPQDADPRFRIGLTLALLVAGVGLYAWRTLGPPGQDAQPGRGRGTEGSNAASPHVERPSWTHRGEVYGSSFQIKVVLPAAPKAAPSATELAAAVDAALARVDVSMSTYRTDSEIARINSAPAGVTQVLSTEMGEVLRTAIEVNEASGSAFDPTVMALVDAWGFGPGGAPVSGAGPDDATLEAARAQVGLALLGLETPAGRPATLRKAIPGVRLDLNAIAPGYAADVIGDAFDSLGVDEYMIEVGGEVLAHGRNPAGEVWRIGIEVPDGGSRELYAALPLQDAGLATSGDYRKYREIAGKRVSHTIDPRTGRPIEHGLASVTVIQPTCAAADAWATALNVLGPDEGFELAEARGIPALFITRDGDGFRERTTSALGPMIAAAPSGE